MAKYQLIFFNLLWIRGIIVIKMTSQCKKDLIIYVQNAISRFFPLI